jgi:two-component sensor histidine kinase
MEQFGDRAAAKQLHLREAILRRRGRGARPRWTETGGPPVKPPTRRGFGTRVMDNMTRGRLKGEMRFDWRAEGLACQIVLPV